MANGIYPWNNNIIIPLHKKGPKSDPDNYRAIAVSSTIGKLFSTLLLNRFLRFKLEHSPDPINQLGFLKGAQTYDHLLTLTTLISKYKTLKKPLYAELHVLRFTPSAHFKKWRCTFSEFV